MRTRNLRRSRKQRRFLAEQKRDPERKAAYDAVKETIGAQLGIRAEDVSAEVCEQHAADLRADDPATADKLDEFARRLRLLDEG